MKKFQILLLAEEKGKGRMSRIIEEAVLGEFDTMEELEDEFDRIAETLGLEELEETEDEY